MLTTDLTASERKGFIVNMKKNINRQYYVLKGKEKVKTKRNENKQKRKEKKKVFMKSNIKILVRLKSYKLYLEQFKRE